MERAVALGDRRTIDIGDLPPTIALCFTDTPDTGGAAIQSGLSSTDLEDIERATIERVFEQVKGDKVMAGKMLGVSRATLYRKLKRYNIGGQTLNCRPAARRCSRGVDHIGDWARITGKPEVIPK